MGKKMGKKLTALEIRSLKKPGMYLDERGLYLQVSSAESKSWILRFSLNKKRHDMGLGSYPDVSLNAARELASQYRVTAKQGINPILARKQERIALSQQLTFEQCAIEYIDLHKSGWKSAKNVTQWTGSLTAHVYPIIGSKNVSAIDKADILAVLSPIWPTINETAGRVKQRIKSILDWAAAKDYRVEQDARLWHQVTAALPKTKPTVKHLESCPYSDVASTIEAIKATGADDNVKLGMEFLILTAARTGEMRHAEWSEIDFNECKRTIPAEKMKAKKEHRIPLCPRAMEILNSLKDNGSKLIFPNKSDKPYSDMTFTTALRRLEYKFTVHGFRSSFRDWCAEQANYPSDICEAALAHANPDKTAAAYFRSDLFEKRRELMNEWSNYLAS